MPPPLPSERRATLQHAATSRAIVLTEIEAMGGAERSVLALCRWLHEHGVPHHVVSYIDHVGLAAHASTPLEVVQLQPLLRARHKIAALRRYFAAHESSDPPSPKPLMSGYQPALHATLAGLRGFHCLMHDTPSLFENAASLTPRRKLARRFSDAITGFGLRSGGATLVTSEYLKGESSRAFGVEAEVVRMGGLPSPQAEGRSRSHIFRPRRVEGVLHLLSVSRLEANKRLDWLLRSLTALAPAAAPIPGVIDWQLHIVGRGSEADTLVTLAQSLGLSDRVHFYGFVSDAELEQLYAQAHLFLMPAVQGYGIPAIEALSRGIPVLLHRDSGVSDILLASPWATVFTGGEDHLLSALEAGVRNVIAGTQMEQPLPQIPTEDQWAERVATLCGWL